MEKKKIKKTEIKAVMSALGKKSWSGMTKEQKTERARKMALGRWGNKKEQGTTP